ncbi:YHS domain-containing (seleno)protein [Histidinibacterium aquaticum]|uniref:YHS domain protein n=1 Tax=Histidinibacterium aquaticum TaxID=2613962 RepID=A0A5J5GD70_9RHOB|nr:YHS domain-containing (seleno)protein [Histidinibacterium aquaticum]KAA9005722.1 YHS domain protein [Histidinibacterium aquaticum]
MDRRRLLTLALAAPALLPATRLIAAEPEIFSVSGQAIRGIDPVAYFQQSAPVSGGADMLMWKGATWAFSSADNRAAFEREPERWAPAYGGYCAWAAAQGYLAPTVPEAWTVHDGRLYLNASLRIRDRWLRDVEGNIAQADMNWPGLVG